jgi:hypothetical protein
MPCNGCARTSLLCTHSWREARKRMTAGSCLVLQDLDAAQCVSTVISSTTLGALSASTKRRADRYALGRVRQPLQAPDQRLAQWRLNTAASAAAAGLPCNPRCCPRYVTCTHEVGLQHPPDSMFLLPCIARSLVETCCLVRQRKS